MHPNGMREDLPSTSPAEPPQAETVPTQAGYDRWAEFYDDDDNPLVRLEESRFGALLGGVAGPAVADIGCVIISVMHPAMSLRGVQARFTEPGTGRRILLASQTHQLSEYVMAAVGAGLDLAHLSEHAIDSDMAARSSRAARYMGWPMLLLMKLVAVSGSA